MKETGGDQKQIQRSRRRNSILLIIGIAAVAAVMLIAYTAHMSGIGRPMLEITVGGRIYGTYDLNRDQTIQINHTNTCEIRDGKVSMRWADCPDQICVKSVAIDRTGGSIVCMPNKIVLTIVNADASDDTPDTVAG